MEDAATKEWMAKYGMDKVRGGSYCSPVLTPQSRECLRREICHIKRKCYNCDNTGHVARDCPKDPRRAAAQAGGAAGVGAAGVASSSSSPGAAGAATTGAAAAKTGVPTPDATAIHLTSKGSAYDSAVSNLLR
jgi:hypothetical protein